MSRLDNARAAFEARLLAAEQFVLRSVSARHPQANRPALLTAHVEWAHEAALLKVVVASERFLETALGLYAIGERTRSGYRPRVRRRVDLSLPAMLYVFRGDQDFVGWNDPAAVIRRAEAWLRNGDPFQTPLAAASQLLTYLRQMRNAIAHESDSATEKYERATRRLYGALPRRTAPGAQLTRPPPASIPYLAGASLFEASIATYRLLAKGIVP